MKHTVERYEPYGMPEYAGIRVDGAFVFNDAIPDEDLRLRVSRAQAVLDFRAAERRAADQGVLDQHVPRPGDHLAPTRGHHLAVCQDCDEPMVMPFGDDADARRAWTEGHSGALGHRVTWQQP